MDSINLYRLKKNCAGCSACMNICPVKAISMIEDEYGFIYPKINSKKCIKCGLCNKVCSYQNDKLENFPQKTYVAVTNDNILLKNAASGGIFGALATSIINKGGVVYGCSMEKEDRILTPKHIRIEELNEIKKLQGSKYAKSVINDIYILVKKDLLDGRIVLFSGTPCQVAALKSFLTVSKINIDNLYVLDIICHGTPSTKFFQDYIKYYEKKLNVKIMELHFRDKKFGWGLKGSLLYENCKGHIKNKVFYADLSSYYTYFLEGSIYRENCYSCKYASKNRVGDITIGDFWGVELEHPDYLCSNGGNIESSKGVSCLIVNTNKGKELLDLYGDKLIVLPSNFCKAKRVNHQLNNPTPLPKNRKEILKIYQAKGYKGVESIFKKKKGIKYYLKPLYLKIKEGIK